MFFMWKRSFTQEGLWSLVPISQTNRSGDPNRYLSSNIVWWGDTAVFVLFDAPFRDRRPLSTQRQISVAISIGSVLTALRD